MKRLAFFFAVVLFSFSIFAQEEGGEGPDIDLIVQTQSADGYQIKFELVPVSTEYCWYSYCWQFNTASAVSNNTVIINGTSNCYWNGWDYRRCIDDTETDTWICNGTGVPSTIQPLRNGFYRMNIYVNNVFKTYFYYDNRDADLPKGGCWNPLTGCCYTCYYPLRSSIKYNAAQDSLYFHNDFTDELDDPGWRGFHKESILFLRQIKICNPANFSPFWNNGLVAVAQKNPSSGKYEPFIVWGPHKDFNPTGYKIYRKYGASSWQLHTTVSSSTYEYTDGSVTVTLSGQQAGTDVQYKVTAIYNTNNETSPSNVVTVNVQGGEIEKKGYSEVFTLNEFKLDQNYPNPFNPATRITYAVSEDAKVMLKVYDILGVEVAELVNENKPAGYYEITFNASNLSSGIYIYRITALKGEQVLFNESKRMILMK
ncbi:T9SS type A sorting domain-containing protein [Ignavibacterium sp.]|uniref:T9SS type A sorting domain-containing protein n=1 Tax=Ignavibacterium sp. TaxID=2651167 RepID=UPI00307EC4F3